MDSAHIQIAEVEGVADLLQRLFWKQPQMAGKAVEFLDYIRQWGRSETPYRVDQWENYCERHGITQSKYHNMLKRLKRAGMIEKKYNKTKKTHELFLSEGFSERLESMTSAWDNFRKN
ncbi:MAG: hypothetical protein V1921_04890 [Candidatus Altiarchaeota archaeon]